MEFNIEYNTPERGVNLYKMTFTCENGSFELRGSVSQTSCHRAFPKHANDVIVRFDIHRQTMEGDLTRKQVQTYLPQVAEFFAAEALKSAPNGAFIHLGQHLYPIKGNSNPIANRKQKKAVSGKWRGGEYVRNYRMVYNPLS